MEERPFHEQSLWIFGYGSLVWRPDFEFTSSKVGFIPGYSRKFWQGDNFHRGSPEMVSINVSGISCYVNDIIPYEVLTFSLFLFVAGASGYLTRRLRGEFISGIAFP